MPCYSWERDCGGMPTPCQSTAPTACANTETWFWVLAAVAVIGVIAASSKKS